MPAQVPELALLAASPHAMRVRVAAAVTGLGSLAGNVEEQILTPRKNLETAGT